MEQEYLTLKNMGLYPPAKKPAPEETKYKAMQAKVNHLEKECNATQLFTNNYAMRNRQLLSPIRELPMKLYGGEPSHACVGGAAYRHLWFSVLADSSRGHCILV